MSNEYTRVPVLAGASILWLTGFLCAGNALATIPGSTVTFDPSFLDPQYITTLDFDTNGDGNTDYRIVGDVDSDGVLEWSDIQSALDGMCDPNADGQQNSSDGKLADLDNDGQVDDPYCGTLHILPGDWTSPVTLEVNKTIVDDDQFQLKDYQGLWFRGSGSDRTFFRTAYSRWQYCRSHHETGCGGICSRHSEGFLRISGFTFEGLEPRTWTDKNDCDGDGLTYFQDPDYTVRTTQTGLTVSNIAPDVARDVVVQDVVVTQADYNGYFFSQIDNLTVSDLKAMDVGGAGIWFASIRNSYGGSLHVERADNGFSLGGISITSSYAASGQPQPIKTQDLVLDHVTSINNDIGIRIAAAGAGGISDLTISNYSIFEPRNSAGVTATEWGILVHDNTCYWDENNDGIVNELCYITNLTFDNGDVTGSPHYGFTSNLNPGSLNRNIRVRNTRFEGNGYAVGGTDSRNVNLMIPGLVFEGNTVISDDYNQDGNADVTHLVRVQADNIVVRNNEMSGQVNGGNSAILYARQSDNLTLEGNTLTCNNGPGTSCMPLSFWSDVTNTTVERNTLQMTDPAGIAMRLQGDNSIVSSNTLFGGRLEVYGNGHNILSNRVEPSPAASVPHGMRLLGTNAFLAHNICEPSNNSSFCVEIRPSGTGATLLNNRNLFNLDNMLIDWTGSATVQ